MKFYIPHEVESFNKCTKFHACRQTGLRVMMGSKVAGNGSCEIQLVRVLISKINFNLGNFANGRSIGREPSAPY